MKYLFIILTALLLSGCGYTINDCKEKQYKGIVAHLNSTNTNTYCSDGKIINNQYFTNSGEKNIEYYIFLEFKE
jgi:hypothetical protein